MAGPAAGHDGHLARLLGGGAVAAQVAGRVPVFGLNRIDAELITPQDIIARAQEVTENVR